MESGVEETVSLVFPDISSVSYFSFINRCLTNGLSLPLIDNDWSSLCVYMCVYLMERGEREIGWEERCRAVCDPHKELWEETL